MRDRRFGGDALPDLAGAFGSSRIPRIDCAGWIDQVIHPRSQIMTTLYRHTQPGALSLAAMLSAAVGTATIGFFCQSPSTRSLLWVGAVALTALGWLFSSLTVEVTEDELRWRFGPGILRYRMARAEIVSVQAVRNAF
jgi:hypothetical protein